MKRFHVGCARSVAQHTRTYYHHIPDTLVPKGFRTSAFQSSSVPSERMQAVRKYAALPLYEGDEVPLIIVGTPLTTAELVRPHPEDPTLTIGSSLKQTVKTIVASLTSIPTEELKTSTLQALRPSLLHKGQLLQDAYRVEPKGEVVARTLFGVYPVEGCLEDDEDLMVLQRLLRDQLQAANCEEREALKAAGILFAEFVHPDHQVSFALEEFSLNA